MSRFSGDTTGTISMRGYISRLTSADDPWPETYIIVETSPDRWMATLSLTELRQALDGLEGAPLRGIPYRWEHSDLVVAFGPVHVCGDRNGWLSLARRVLDAAGSAAGLYEVPGARPWDGPTVLVSVDDVDVAGRAPRPDRPVMTPDAKLAVAGGFSEEEFGELCGLGWRPLDAGEDVELFGEDLFVWGDPVQLAASIDFEGNLRIGQPVATSDGPAGLAFEIVDPVPVHSSMPQPLIESYVKELLRRRRRAFSWCRYCGSLLAPEQRLERNVCYGCGTAVHGIVY